MACENNKVTKLQSYKVTRECDFVACIFFRNFALSLREMAAQPAADSMARQATPPATRGDAAGRNTPKAKARRQATHGEAKRQQFQPCLTLLVSLPLALPQGRGGEGLQAGGKKEQMILSSTDTPSASLVPLSGGTIHPEGYSLVKMKIEK